jgi:hypothetical protein
MAGPGLRHGVLTMPITRRTVIPNIVPPPAIPGTLLATSGLTSVKWVETIADGQTVYDGLGTAAPAVGSCA